MRLGARIRGLERSAQRASAGRACASCGLARLEPGGGARICAEGPLVIRHITEISSAACGDADTPCAGCGRVAGVLVLRIPPPVPAREAA